MGKETPKRKEFFETLCKASVIVLCYFSAQYKYTSFDKIVRKFDAKLLKYRILFKDILTLLGFDYRDASPIILYFIVIEIIHQKTNESDDDIT